MSRKYLLVHGAWQGQWAWKALATALQDEGHEVSFFDLPGSGDDMTPATQVSLDTCAGRVLEKTQALSTSGDVILVGHSMGGAVVTHAASVSPELYSRVVYICAFLPAHGESVMQLGEKSAQMGVAGPVASVDASAMTATLNEEHVAATFFNDGKEEDYLPFIKLFRPQPLAPVVSPVAVSEAFKVLKKSYVICTLDQAISPSLQRIMAERAEVDDIRELESGHEPFITARDRLFDILHTLPSY